jgi:signal transduction histidine kinase/DNA-binding response OmpR family regulator
MSRSEESSDPLFAGDSEMALLMRRFDWSRTPLGPSATWPHSLRAAVRIILTSRFAMWLGWGPELTFFYNDAYATMTLGAKHPWALGRPAREVWAEIWQQIGPRIEQVMSTGVATWDERLMLFLERSGYREETYHTFSYSPLSDDADRTSGMLCVVSEETERVIGERRLSILAELAAQLTAADTTDDVLVAIGDALEQHARDLPFTLLYSLPPEGDRPTLSAVTGMALDHPAALAAGENAHARWSLERVLETGTPEVITLDPTVPWPAGPWHTPPAQAIVAPIPQSGQSRPQGVLVAALNAFRPFDEAYRNFLGLFVGQLSAAFSSARAFESERRRAQALAELDRAKTAFFSNVSHEFRTPLTLMLGPTEDALAASRALAGAELAAVHRNQLRLLKLVNTLLDFSRIEAGRAKAVYQKLDLAALTQDLASTFRSTVERAGLRFEVRVSPLPEPVYVDPQMWEGVLLNLLSNAFKFTFEGAIGVELRALGPGKVELRVSDTGVGIPAAELPRVFERFHRIEGSKARTHEGSGIGLALVRDLVKLHGGEIAVDSRLGAGTSFSVTIPTGSAHLPSDRLGDAAPRRTPEAAAAPFVAEALRWLPAEASEAPASELRAPGDSSAKTPEAHVLVADDNADMRDYLRRLLRERWSVETANDGAEALAAARARRPDLILTDVMMPGSDGFALLHSLRADRELRSIPVIMLSARAGEEARIEGIEAGADDYLVKPFSARELVARVSTRLELVRLNTRLQVERASIANLFEQTPMPVAVFRGPELVFEVANEPYVSGVGGRELFGKPLLEALPELTGQGFDTMLHRVMDTGVPYVGHEELVKLNKHGQLEDTYWTFIYAPIRGEKGKIDSVIALCNHVTEQVIARQRLEGLAQEAARANRAKDEFLAMLGHELRNPLAPMVTALQLMRLRGLGSKEQDVLERQVAHLARLVDDLLDVSRITRGKIELDRRKVELSEVVQRAMEIASPVLEHSHHQVDNELAKRGLVIDADIDRLAQVVSNLLTNAAKYSDARSRITVRGGRADGQVWLSVKDQGIGIDPEMIGEVFDAFVQQPQAIDRSRGGLGLGLTIVRSLVEMHGGSVRAASEGRGQGSEFIVELPAIDGAGQPSRPPLSTRLGTVSGAKKKRVLVVDDNDDAAVMLKHALERLGYRVAIAHDGPSALRTSALFEPDVALLDIGLPVMDGYELAQRLRETEAGAGVRLVAVTGYGQETDRARSSEAGFAKHLVKPLDLGMLEDAIEDGSETTG